MERKLYTICYDGSNTQMETLQVFCTKSELDIICSAIVGKVFDYDKQACTCIAAEGDTCTFSEFDFMYSDRM